jgi:hypothetical protein
MDRAAAAKIGDMDRSVAMTFGKSQRAFVTHKIPLIGRRPPMSPAAQHLGSICADFVVVDAVPGNWSPATKFAAYRQNNREFLNFWPHSAKSKA